MNSKIINIGILAHVDAGKTSLTEQLLYVSGMTKNIGSVDKGSAVTDNLDLEKSRGISIKTATVSLVWKDTQINIVDTPGHIDFSAEVDRVLSVLDMVVLVVSAVEGVQAHTLNLWESIRERGLPCLIFINKIDRVGADLVSVFRDLEKDLNIHLFALNYADNDVHEALKLFPFNQFHRIQNRPIIEISFENLADLDEAFLEDFLEGNLADTSAIYQKAMAQIQTQCLMPTLFGSAKMGLEIEFLLDTIIRLFQSKAVPSKEVSAKVFKIEYHKKLGRLAYLRMYSGTLKSKDTIWNQHLNKTIKINQIFKKKLAKYEQDSSLHPHEIGMVSTTELIQSGDVLGQLSFEDNFHRISESVLSVQVLAEEDKDYQKLADALDILNLEDPQLNFQWYKDSREFHLKILGPIQTEVLKDALLSRFNIAARFLPPKIIYKETPKTAAEGFVRYWMPKPCWAIMTFLIEAADVGSGLSFESKVRTSEVSTKYQNEVKRAIPWALRQGIKGWEVTDLKITLLKGEEHQVHSNPGDFLLATPMGILRGIQNADTDLLEPMYAFHIKAPQIYLGAIISDLNQMYAQINAPDFDGNFFALTGRVAVEKAMNYGIQFNSSTSGKGRLKLRLDGYQKTETTADKLRPYQGVSPLDEAQWILHNRGAFKAEERMR